ncbi:MAG: pimeloyl-CoA dehydrogenase small subunit [Acetobacteraceae bacterium]|nr:pimeloyl-CoA dehydrogenase small subunit [Acetobacteraceae bacterium]MSP30886.1 pimeloyl-CoA dehydrogenase small subunit [Acetobacteraceae bacterium]
MDFEFSDEQRLLKDSVERLIADRYGFESRKTYLASATGWSTDVWAQYAELGLLGLPFADEYGGFGGGPVETMIVMEAFGRGLVLEPYFATVILGGGVLRHAASAAQRSALLPLVGAGKLKLALAHVERHSRYDLAHVTTNARRDGDGWVINGTKSVVLHGDCADKIFVSARISGGSRDRGGIGIFLVNAAAVTRQGYLMQDGLRAAEISFVNAPAEAVGDPEAGLALLERVTDEALAALAAESIGIMTEMHELTVEYLKTRQQFGRPIGQFQVLQHRSVDMFVALEQARSITLYATMMASDDNAQERARAMAATKTQVGKSGRHIGQECVQLHGGIGMTAEYKAGHYFKRMTMIDKMYGDADFHLAALARMGGIF